MKDKQVEEADVLIIPSGRNPSSLDKGFRRVWGQGLKQFWSYIQVAFQTGPSRQILTDGLRWTISATEIFQLYLTLQGDYKWSYLLLPVIDMVNGELWIMDLNLVWRRSLTTWTQRKMRSPALRKWSSKLFITSVLGMCIYKHMIWKDHKRGCTKLGTSGCIDTWVSSTSLIALPWLTSPVDDLAIYTKLERILRHKCLWSY